MSAHAPAHPAHPADAGHATEADPVEAVTAHIAWVIPLAGAIMIFLLAAIAVTVA